MSTVSRRTVGGLDEAQAGCIYDFTHGGSVVLVGFGGLVATDLVGFGDDLPDGSAVEPAAGSTPVAAPFEFFETVSDIPVGKVFVRDLDQIFYQRGVRGLGSTIAEVRAGLAALLESSERVVFVGQSAGGYAALLFGSLIGVDEVVAFSPSTFLTRRHRWLNHDRRWPEAVSEIHRIHPLRRSHLDLRKVLRRSPHRTRISVHFGNKNVLDRAHAGWLDGIPNVTLVPFPTASHAVARRMREAQRLKPVLLEALGRSDEPAGD